MDDQYTVHTLEGELPPRDGSKRLASQRMDRNGRPRRIVRMKRLAHRDPVSEAGMLRNKLVIQEMRIAYNQLTGVGDCLLDYKLNGFLRKPAGVAKLGRVDLSALNYDLAKLAASIFGPVVAKAAYDRVGCAIDKAFA